MNPHAFDPKLSEDQKHLPEQQHLVLSPAEQKIYFEIQQEIAEWKEDDFYDHARGYYDQKKYDVSLTYYDELKKEKPAIAQQVKWLMLRANIYLRGLRFPASAIESFCQALEQEPANHEALLGKIECRFCLSLQEYNISQNVHPPLLPILQQLLDQCEQITSCPENDLALKIRASFLAVRISVTLLQIRVTELFKEIPNPVKKAAKLSSPLTHQYANGFFTDSKPQEDFKPDEPVTSPTDTSSSQNSS